ncbi:aminotransferase class I/II-fold pyridoxal phosphate-dependent enzyme [Hymenobacter elongatus]|uniref:Pyridoxal phosphate-dependent aminotransferase family protein n=1 Tax=Hymenobacter elongatus TaxID=877208 RepID=A0A4Z0PT61_9BACT|nr:aminotransferase class I/II-fold pyridoxal phosphate-dependent enzyme [Hymenobacter elongatus]TGE20053.1 pyridoxal phosphate-dependent aminotransferase family protein [Hymenobacter elongatus]
MDFTSALYLGERSVTIPAGLPLTFGKPAALHEPCWQRAVAREVARRQGLETGLLAPSTLHLFWDVFRLPSRSTVIFIDRNMYPVGHWGSARALLRGLAVVPFAADNLPQLLHLLHTHCQGGKIPWLVTDGWNLTAARAAPLAHYLALLEPYPDGVLLLDDTQAFGVLGAAPTGRLPLGHGGGGCLPFVGVRSAKLLTITSLAKGLGVPVAVLAGSASRLARYERRSDVRVHTSPVSNLHAWVARAALRHDACHGDEARQRLGQRIRQFRGALAAAGICPQGGLFPVQKLLLPCTTAALSMQQQLRQHGIETLLLADTHRPTVPQVAFCLRADHSAADIRAVTECVAALARHTRWFSSSITSPIGHENDAHP